MGHGVGGLARAIVVGNHYLFRFGQVREALGVAVGAVVLLPARGDRPVDHDSPGAQCDEDDLQSFEEEFAPYQHLARQGLDAIDFESLDICLLRAK